MGKIFRILILTSLLIPYGLSPAAGQDVESEMQTVLYKMQSAVSELQQKLNTGNIISEADYTGLKELSEQISATHLKLKGLFDRQQDKVTSLGAKASDRHREMMAAYAESIDKILSISETIKAKKDITPQVVNDLKSNLDKVLPRKKRPVFGSLPYRSLGYTVCLPDESSQINPAFMGGNTAVTADDLASTPSAPISKSIAELAESLHWNPVEIYEYVKNNIKTQWYWGCMKGAEQTLCQKSGNDCDQAALLVALLRASKYPARYVRGIIEFFPDIAKAKNLMGIDQPNEIAGFFQKAGIPYEPVITGGRIANFRIEHIWAETLIPYANYRGAVIDEHGKRWMAVDTSIKAAGFSKSTPVNILDDIALDTFETSFLAQVRTETPLSYLVFIVNQYFTQHQPSKTYGDTLLIREQLPENLGEVPASPQFKINWIAGEYAQVPDNLIHQTRFVAKAGENIVFDVSFPAYQLSNRQIELIYEPETVEDQEIINSYGGLDNTPCYLVRLRPVIKINGERVAIGADGLPMGSDYTFLIDLSAPNGAHQEVINTPVIGNPSIIGLVCQDVVHPEPAPAEAQDAAWLLYEEALNYIDRWNQAEDELAQFFQIALARPIPAIVTLAGVIDVSYLLDTPHGYTWKGLYVDADLRAAETAGGYRFADSQQDAEKLFKQISGLEGSALEGRLLEDDFGITSISTSELFALAHQRNIPIQTIDDANIDELLPLLPVDDAVKDSIADSVNQWLTVNIPASELSYEDWQGIGYLIENPDTGDSGWMLTGMIAGAMTVLSPDNPEWDKYGIFKFPNSGPANSNPGPAASIHKIPATDMQQATVGTPLAKPLQVKVLDANGKPVEGAKVVFAVKKGGGQAAEGITDKSGIASANFTVGQHTADNPAFIKEQGNEYATQVGLNIVDAYLEESGVHLKVPFTAYGFPDIPDKILRICPYGHVEAAVILHYAGPVEFRIVDQYDNPVSNQNVVFSTRVEILVGIPGEIAMEAKFIPIGTPCLEGFPSYNECGIIGPYSVKTNSTGYAAIGLMMGAIYPHHNNFYIITASSGNLKGDVGYFMAPLPHFFHSYIYPGAEDGINLYPVEEEGINIQSGKPGSSVTLRAQMDFIVKDESGEYTVVSDLNNNPEVKFNGNLSTPVGNGEYTYNYTILPGVNVIRIDYLTYGIIKDFLDIRVYGVEVKFSNAVEGEIPFSVDDDGYLLCDATLNFTITPAEYQARDCYIMIYKNGQPISAMKVENQGSGYGTISKGFKFDVGASYTAKVILNHGAGEPLEIESDEVTLKLNVVKIDIAMDGNRDGEIIFEDPRDSKYLFWVNDDVDEIGEESGEEDDRDVGMENYDDDIISCKRDLEDFTRLHIRINDDTVNLPGITYWLKFENVTEGFPMINVYEAVNKSLDYLQDDLKADQQIKKQNLTLEGIGNVEVQIDNKYIKTGDELSPFIIEGRSAGKGDLTFVVKKDDMEISEKKFVSLDLRPITQFYQKYVASISADDDVNETSTRVGTYTYTPEKDQYVLFVHGWNVPGWEKDRWAETIFKRFWWLNYKGHVGCFQWPTLNFWYYDRSELRAWNSAQALYDSLVNLNAAHPGQVRVIAHSMGNVVMGEALKLSPPNLVYAYIAAQAAIPAHCYDNTTRPINNFWTDFITPNFYGFYYSGIPDDSPYLKNNPAKVATQSISQYFNTDDYALSAWELNNWTKLDLNYYYEEEENNNIDRYNPPGDRFYYKNILSAEERTLIFDDDRFEIFARCAQSRSQALGREPSVNGFGPCRNLHSFGYDDSHYSHSREFRSNVIAENQFWETVWKDFNLDK